MSRIGSHLSKDGEYFGHSSHVWWNCTSSPACVRSTECRCQIAQRGCWAGLGIASQLPAVSSFHSSLVKSIRDGYLGAGRRAVTQRVPQHLEAEDGGPHVHHWDCHCFSFCGWSSQLVVLVLGHCSGLLDCSRALAPPTINHQPPHLIHPSSRHLPFPPSRRRSLPSSPPDRRALSLSVIRHD